MSIQKVKEARYIEGKLLHLINGHSLMIHKMNNGIHFNTLLDQEETEFKVNYQLYMRRKRWQGLAGAWLGEFKPLLIFFQPQS